MKLTPREDLILGAFLLGAILAAGVSTGTFGILAWDLVQTLALLGVGGFLMAYSIFGFWALMTGRWSAEDEP